MAVAGDEKEVEAIMDGHEKQKESIENHSKGIEMRVKMLCRKAQVSYEEYIEALGTSTNGYSVVLKRDLDEIYINPYNREWMKAWNANMDIQLAMDPFAIITYVVNYMNKDETGLTAFLKETLTKIPANTATKEKS